MSARDLAGDVSAADHAWRVAEDVRRLNAATFSSDGYQDPSDVDAVIGGLRVAADRIPQALRQASQWLAAQNGRLRSDDGQDMAGQLRRVYALLTAAEAEAHGLAATLESVRSVTAHLTTD